MIPILLNHEYNNPPIGQVIKRDGRIVLQFYKDKGVDFSSLINQDLILDPAYTIVKQAGSLVIECELTEISLIATARI